MIKAETAPATAQEIQGGIAGNKNMRKRGIKMMMSDGWGDGAGSMVCGSVSAPLPAACIATAGTAQSFLGGLVDDLDMIRHSAFLRNTVHMNSTWDRSASW